MTWCQDVVGFSLTCEWTSEENSGCSLNCLRCCWWIFPYLWVDFWRKILDVALNNWKIHWSRFLNTRWISHSWIFKNFFEMKSILEFFWEWTLNVFEIFHFEITIHKFFHHLICYQIWFIDSHVMSLSKWYSDAQIITRLGFGSQYRSEALVLTHIVHTAQASNKAAWL